MNTLRFISNLIRDECKSLVDLDQSLPIQFLGKLLMITALLITSIIPIMQVIIKIISP